MGKRDGEGGIQFLRVLADAADAIVARSRIANHSGKTFGGARDLYETCGYKRELTAGDYRSRYKRNAIAARVVEVKPLDTWRGGFDVIDEQDLDKDTEFEKAWDALEMRLQISTVFQRADIVAGIGRYAVILIGAPGDMDQPLESVSSPEEIEFLRVYAEEDAPIKEWDTDSTSPRFGMPVFYELKRTNPQSRTGAAGVVGKKAHYTRIIHIADGLLDDMVHGTPRLENVWNLLDDLEKITGGGSEAFWMRANQGMHVNIDSSLNPTAGELETMKTDVEKYRHKLERVIRTRGADIKTLGSDVADIKGPTGAIIDQIAAGKGIPVRVFMGSEQGKLAADQDSVKYYRMIEARRVDFAENQVVEPFINRLIELTALPEPKDGEYEVRWSQIKTRDEEEKASLATKWASLNTGGEIVVTGDEIREHCLGLEPLEDVTGVKRVNTPPEPTARNAARKEGSSATDIQRAADRFRPTLKRSAEAAFDKGKVALNSDALRAALKEKNEREVFVLVSGAIVTVANTLKADLEEILTDVVNSSGTAAARRLRKARQASVRVLADSFAFDKTNPKAVEWIKNHAAEMVTGISDTTREEIRQLVEDAFEEQFDVDELTQEIEDLIGNEDRADNIARTETMKASNQGQVLAWDQAIEEGLLTGEEEQEWIVTPDDRLCPVCEPLDGVKVPLGGQFDTENGKVDGPPAHPRCRCTIALSV